MNKVITLFAASTLLLGACASSNQVAQQSKYNDDVYYSDMVAVSPDDVVKKERVVTRRERDVYYDDETTYDDYGYGYGYNNYNYNTYRAPWRYSYYNPYRIDPWFDYYTFGYNRWYSPSISFYIGSNPWYYNNIYGYNYGYPYLGSYYGGNVLYNSYYPGYNYGGYYGGNVIIPTYVDKNYRPRPSLRGSENIGGGVTGLQTTRQDANGRVITTPSRGQIYQRNNGTNGSQTPSRGSQNGNPSPRPARVQNTEPRNNPQPVYTPQPDRSSAASSGNNGGGGGGGGSSSSSDRARPSRAGN